MEEGESGEKCTILKKKELLEIERSNVPLITLSFNPEAGIVNIFLDFDFVRSSKLWIQN